MKKKYVAVMKDTVGITTAVSLVIMQLTAFSVQGSPIIEKRCVNSNMNIVNAECKGNGVELDTNFSYENASQKIKNIIDGEVAESTGVVDKDLEKSLNYAGVLDSEIEDFTDEDIENLENTSEISVKIECGYVDEDTGRSVLVEPEECDSSYYANSRVMEEQEDTSEFHESTENEEKNESNFIQKTCNKLGLIPITAYASNNTACEKTSGGKFRHFMYVAGAGNINGCKAAYFKYTAQWLETPKNCFLDYFTLFTSGIPIQPNNTYGLTRNISFTETMNEITYGKNVEKIYSMKKSMGMSDSNYEYCGDSSNGVMFIKQELPGGLHGEDYLHIQDIPYKIDYQYVYSDIKMVTGGYLLKMDGSRLFTVNAKYYHLQKNKPEIKITGVSIKLPNSISVSFNYSGAKEYYESLTKNLYVHVYK